MLVIWMVPESHIYHARKGNDEAAKRSMLRLYGNAPDYDVVREREPPVTGDADSRNTSTLLCSMVSRRSSKPPRPSAKAATSRSSEAPTGAGPSPVASVSAASGVPVLPSCSATPR